MTQAGRRVTARGNCRPEPVTAARDTAAVGKICPCYRGRSGAACAERTTDRRPLSVCYGVGSRTGRGMGGVYVCAPGEWGSQEEADAAAGIMAPRLQHHLAGNTVAPPERKLYPVIESA